MDSWLPIHASSSPFHSSSPLQSSLLQSQTLNSLLDSLKLSQTLTISHSIKSKLFLQIQSTNPSRLQCHYSLPFLPPMPSTAAVVHSSLHSYRRCLVLTPPLCTLHGVSKVIFLCFSSLFFVSLVGFICYGNQMLKSNKPKDSYYETLTKKKLRNANYFTFVLCSFL